MVGRNQNQRTRGGQNNQRGRGGQNKHRGGGRGGPMPLMGKFSGRKTY